jgi:hypothetical protein
MLHPLRQRSTRRYTRVTSTKRRIRNQEAITDLLVEVISSLNRKALKRLRLPFANTRAAR